MLAADGCPAAVALLLALGLERCLSHGEQPAALLNHLPLPVMAPACRHGAMQANYRYLLRLVSRKSQRVSLACWRRYPGGLGNGLQKLRVGRETLFGNRLSQSGIRLYRR
ncbi:MAG: hypothetical protein EBZ76_00005, partial [Synechococcaceae bacterium WB9_2_170]|nr:hypothetical protein [Synechococcaceae bacterium WB9_2_170]